MLSVCAAHFPLVFICSLSSILTLVLPLVDIEVRGPESAHGAFSVHTVRENPVRVLLHSCSLKS